MREGIKPQPTDYDVASPSPSPARDHLLVLHLRFMYDHSRPPRFQSMAKHSGALAILPAR